VTDDRGRRRRYRSLDDFETLRELTRNLGEGIYITNAAGEILDANQSFLSIFGVHTLEALAAYRAADLLVDPDRRAFELALLARDGSVREFELQIRRLDGQVRTVLDTTYSCRDPETGEEFFHGILVDITRRKELEDQLREQTIRDALTGCYNRRYLFDLGDELEMADDSNWGCIFIDIDHFKRYNDTHGHHKGDRMLVQLSRFVMNQVRAEEPVIRIGGDEFLIVLSGDNAMRTEQVAVRLQSAARRGAPVSFSLGWAIRAPEETFAQTVDRADQKLIGVRVFERTGEWPKVQDGSGE
jgi:diguanylate cyclase (GGDEF)-like protein/PAS domain S-box-containing protein